MRRLLPFVLLAGCATTKYVPTNPAPHQLATRTPDQIEVLRTPPMGRGFTELGVFDVCDPSYDKAPGEDPKVVKMLKDNGAKRGCDVVQLVSQNHIDDGLSTRDMYRARCIVWQ